MKSLKILLSGFLLTQIALGGDATDLEKEMIALKDIIKNLYGEVHSIKNFNANVEKELLDVKESIRDLKIYIDRLQLKQVRRFKDHV
jgi:hypothetical protein